jgi:hypothetical protein
MRRFAASFKLGAVPFGDRLCCVPRVGAARLDVSGIREDR